MLGAIVGLEIGVERLEGKFKLSQNKQERDRLGAAQALDELGHRDLARHMRRP
jgi:transcriptional regulator